MKKQFEIRNAMPSFAKERQTSIYQELFDAFDALKPGKWFVVEDDLNEADMLKIRQAFYSRPNLKATLRQEDGKLWIGKLNLI